MYKKQQEKKKQKNCTSTYKNKSVSNRKSFNILKVKG